MENIDIDWKSLLNAYTNPSKQKKSKQRQWLKSKNLRPSQRICPNCKNVVRQPSYDPNEYTLYPYCPYCGKKIDGGRSQCLSILSEVHGEWGAGRFNLETGNYEEQCTHCRNFSKEYDKPYCPNCGAKMSGGKKDG